VLPLAVLCCDAVACCMFDPHLCRPGFLSLPPRLLPWCFMCYPTVQVPVPHVSKSCYELTALLNCLHALAI
jgi:hypothetical protein